VTPELLDALQVVAESAAVVGLAAIITLATMWIAGDT
jgi:hypothetical protein